MKLFLGNSPLKPDFVGHATVEEERKDPWNSCYAYIERGYLPPITLALNLTVPENPEPWHVLVLNVLYAGLKVMKWRAKETKKHLDGIRSTIT